MPAKFSVNCLKTLRLLASSQPLNNVEAFLLLAEVYAAQSQLDSAAETAA